MEIGTRRIGRPMLVAAAVLAVVALVVGLWAFQPWRLFTRSTLDEALPAASPVSAAPSTGPSAQAPAAAEPVVLGEESFVSQEHPTSGVAKLVRLGDGSLVLRLENLASSDGPDLHVWLTDRPAGDPDWASYDDGRYLRLGKLKATDGNHNYPVPPDAELSGLRSVVIWCDRFNVAFGSAALPI